MKQVTIFIFLSLIICLSTSCQNKNLKNDIQFKEVRRPYKTISPILSKLLKMDSVDLETETEKIWITAKQHGLPLVEEDSLDLDYKYVTLIFQDSTKSKNISFDVYGIYDEYRFGDMKLHQLGKTDLYYRCYKVPNDICFSYRFNITDTLTGMTYKETDKYNDDRIPRGEIRNFSYSVLDLRKIETDWNVKRYNNLSSRIDTLKYTDTTVNKERNIYVYLPPDYDKNRKEAYPVIYLFDAYIYLNRVEVPNILDNLVTEKKIEPMIAVLFGTFRSTRGITLPLNSEFRNEFVSEFLPFIRNNYNTSLKPENSIIGGISYGGLAAAYFAFYHPDIFGQVLSQSGSFWRGLNLQDQQGKSIREDWLIEKYLSGDKKNLKLYLDWGLQENNVLGSNRRMVRALSTKNYEYKFTEFNGWHDWSNSRKTFPQGLMYLLQ